MRRQNLDLRITNLSAKARFLETLDALLRDARVIGDSRWDLRRMRFEIDLERIGYEAHTVLVTHERIFEYPSIDCRLTVSPVVSCIDGRSATESWSGQTVEAVQLRDRRELALVTNYGTTRLGLGPDPALEIRDLGPPSEERVICDYGTPSVDLHRASELMRSRVL